MNPLNFPKKHKAALVRPKKWESVDPGETPCLPRIPKLSRREELAQQAEKSGHRVIIDVQAVDKLRAGRHVLPYRKDQPLRVYLHQAGLMMTGVRHAIYDTSNYSKGRLRSSYIPSPNSVILIGPSTYSPILREFQATRVDAVMVQAKMDEKEVLMSPGPAPSKKEQGMYGVKQW